MDLEGLPANLSTFQKLAYCIRGYCLLSTALNYGRDATLFLTMLHIEEARLAMWADCSGLLRNKLEKHLEKNTAVQTTLSKIATLLNDGNEVDRKFTLHWVAAKMPPERGTLENVPAVHHRYVRKAHLEVLMRAGLLQQGRLPIRLHWIALDKSSFEKLIRKLADYNSRLYNSLENHQKTWMQQDFRTMELLLVSTSENIHELSDFYYALSVAHHSEGTVRTLTRIKGLRMLESPSVHPGEIQLLKMMETPLEAPLLHRRLLNLDLDDAKDKPSLARYEGRLVYLEWKPYNVPARKPDNPAVFQRLKDLAALLYASKKGSLPIFNCRGYIEDVVRARYCFVFDFPTQDLPLLKPSPPCTLFELFNSPYTPNASARLSLARALAKCVLELQVVDWLHKGIRSENILFFPPFISALPSLGKPYLCGFEYGSRDTMGMAKEPSPAPPAHNFYEHLVGQVNGHWTNFRFTKEYDVYCLGVVLVEIARWASAKDTGDESEEKVLEDVERRMGRQYKRAVQRCLQSATLVDGKEDHIKGLYREVFHPLDKIVA